MASSIGFFLAGVGIAPPGLWLTNVRSADFRGTKNLIADQIDDAEGDAKTKLPQGISRPAKWRNQGRS